MNFNTFYLGFNDLGLSFSDLEKLLDYESGCTPEPVSQIAKGLLKQSAEICDIRGGYQVFNQVGMDKKEHHFFTINKVPFYAGKIVVQQLFKSELLALFVCTAGDTIEKLSKQLMSQGQLLEGYITDLIGSMVVESAMDKIQDRLKLTMQEQGLHISNRYSPGYCGWETEEQAKLFELLPHKVCGISLNESCLMLPIKSVSGVIGIGREIQYTEYSCTLCDMSHCIYRKIKQ